MSGASEKTTTEHRAYCLGREDERARISRAVEALRERVLAECKPDTLVETWVAKAAIDTVLAAIGGEGAK